jgi:hypothetical protein
MGFFLADSCLSLRVISIYLSVIALELWPASSLTCSLGLRLTSSDMPMCRNQCTVASITDSASSDKLSFLRTSMALSKQLCTSLRTYDVLVIGPFPLKPQLWIRKDREMEGLEGLRQ